jgi:hypothetical protein
LLDPNTAPLRALPREDRDLFIAASNGHVLAFDNVSGRHALSIGHRRRLRRSPAYARTTRHEGYGMSQSRRAMIECIFAGASSTARYADQTSRHPPRRHRLFAQLVFLIEEAPRPIPK